MQGLTLDHVSKRGYWASLTISVFWMSKHYVRKFVIVEWFIHWSNPPDVLCRVCFSNSLSGKRISKSTELYFKGHAIRALSEYKGRLSRHVNYHYKDKTVSRPSYLYDGNSYDGKVLSYETTMMVEWLNISFDWRVWWLAMYSRYVKIWKPSCSQEICSLLPGFWFN